MKNLVKKFGTVILAVISTILAFGFYGASFYKVEFMGLTEKESCYKMMDQSIGEDISTDMNAFNVLSIIGLILVALALICAVVAFFVKTKHVDFELIAIVLLISSALCFFGAMVCNVNCILSENVDYFKVGAGLPLTFVFTTLLAAGASVLYFFVGKKDKKAVAEETKKANN